jgi:DNA-binding NtrC family response regulator
MPDEHIENLLIIGQVPALYDLLKDSPAAAEFRLLFCATDGDILGFTKDNGVRIALLDSAEAEPDDLALLETLKRFDPLLNVIIIGPPGHPEEMLDWIHRGASDFLSRPLTPSTIQAALQKVIEKRELRRETFLLEKKLEKKYIFQGLVSKNPYMYEIFGLIENVAKFFTSVLISGETGTGKDLVARAIHALSDTRNRRLVVCDCASIPENLFESELFGYVRGAFTGADRTKKGLFEDAHEGVIFLDEIGEIPLPIQSKLLRVLENRQFRPLGSNEVKYVNVRVIAATNRDLASCIKTGSFRDDLYHRLNRIEIHIPPLRERTEDIPLLIRYILDTINRTFRKNVKGVSRDVQKLFLRYDWPGNVRELENVLQSAAMVTKKDFIDHGDLPKNLREAAPARGKAPFLGGEKLATLDELEKEYIAHVLKVAGHNLKKAASILSISRTTLYNKLAKYDLPREW